MDWPNDPDGNVFRILQDQGFDFSKPHIIDFHVDFDEWPPSEEALNSLRSLVGEVRLFEPDEHGPGFAHFQFYGLVNYDDVTGLQRRVTLAMSPFAGRCESWGVGDRSNH